MSSRVTMCLCAGLSLALALPTIRPLGGEAAPAGCSQEAWRDFERKLAHAQAAFVRADPEPIKALWSRANDVSLFGGYGGHEVGWTQVGPRLTWASKTNSDGSHDDDEILAKIIGADLALVVQVEHITNRRPDGTAAAVQHLRVTHVARCEGDIWRVVHRHADPLVETKPPLQ
jgi:SnoaL-like protein